jgi:hypothetical protein
MKNNQYVLNFMGITKIFDGKKNTIVPEDEEISISSFNEKTTMRLHLQKC